MTSPNTVVFILFLVALSSVVSSCTFSPLPSVETPRHLFLLSLHRSFRLPPSIPSPCSFLFSTSCITILHGVPRDVSVISWSLISKSSSWQRTRHAEEHRHKAQRQLMRPHTPTATITRPLQHRVSSQLSLVRRTARPQMNTCSEM